MLVFKFKERTGHIKKKFTGFFIDQKLNSLLSLAALGEGVSRSGLFRIIIDNWFKSSNMDEQRLINQVAKRAMEIYRYKNDYVVELTLSDFRRYLESDLRVKKISEEFITRILNRFDVLSRS